METSFSRAARGMTFAQHLAEARRRVLIAIAAIALAAIVAFIAYNQILTVLEHPYCQLHLAHVCKLSAVGTLAGFSIRIKIAIDFGMVFASPVVLWQIWRFVTPGLKRKERLYARGFLVAATVFFLGGATMAFYLFGHALRFLNSIGGSSIQTIYTADSYISLILMMMFLFGLTFEFPVILVGLQLGGVVTPRQLLRAWRFAVIGIAAASAVFTPSGDPFSMFVLMLPLIAFYFLAIAVGKLARR